MISYTGGYKYQLRDEYVHVLPGDFAGIEYNSRFISLSNRVLRIRAGYAWDGPSGPTIDTKTFMRGSLVHDALYQLIREGALQRDLKDPADAELRSICLADGMSRLRAWWVYQAVKKFGMRSAIQNKDIKVAP